MKPDIVPVERAGRGIFTRCWSPHGTPRAALMIVHGLAEHGARYARLAEALTGQIARDVAGALGELGAAELAGRVRKDLPLYVFSGERDPVGAKVHGLIDSYRDAGLTRLTSRIYREGRHEMLNDINRDEVTADLVAWLEGVIP